jgi:hypothetical protein
MSLRKDLTSLQKKIKTRKEALQTLRLSRKESISEADELDHEAVMDGIMTRHVRTSTSMATMTKIVFVTYGKSPSIEQLNGVVQVLQVYISMDRNCLEYIIKIHLNRTRCMKNTVLTDFFPKS